jgi:hypothetical protein
MIALDRLDGRERFARLAHLEQAVRQPERGLVAQRLFRIDEHAAQLGHRARPVAIEDQHPCLVEPIALRERIARLCREGGARKAQRQHYTKQRLHIPRPARGA